MDSKNLERDIAAGLSRLEAISRSLDHDLLEETGALELGEQAATQPWLIAGVSDGIGLQTTIAALDAGILKFGLGVYWEPPHFLELNEDGEPVSPVHFARYQNALALERYAERLGASFEVLSADVIMAPKRGLKGDAKGEPSEFSPQIREQFEKIRSTAPSEDVIFVNSVAFGKWISPREGEEPISVPSVDFEGHLVEMRTKSHHPRGYEETLDTMGRNHGLLLDAIKSFGWLGPDALTVFFTWAGGSQNVDVLEGIYGKGALGDAKVIAERDVVAFRLEHGMDLGAHAIVRLPAFLSAALMGIPGGGLFGLISRRSLEERGLFDDMSDLAAQMLRRLFGPEWIRENPIAQIELDHAEYLYIDEIKEQLDEAHRRIAEYREKQPEEKRGEPIPLDDSRRLLEGLAPKNYREILSKFRPGLAGSVDANIPEEAKTGATEASVTEKAAPPPEEPVQAAKSEPRHTKGGALEFDVDVTALGEAGGAPRPDLTLVAVLQHLSSTMDPEKFSRLALQSEELLIEGQLPRDQTSLTAKFVVQNGGNDVVLTREFNDGQGNVIAAGQAIFVPGERADEETVDPATLGEALGFAMPVREPLETVYESTNPGVGRLLDGPALISFAERNLRSSGLLDETPLPYLWAARLGVPVKVGDRLLTYAKRDGDAVHVTVVNEDSKPVLRLKLK